MDSSVEQFLNIIDNRIEKHLSNNTSNYIKQRLAKIIDVDDDTQKVYLYFIDDKNQTQYAYYNKTGEILSEGDFVKVFYTSDIIKGWIGERSGEPTKREAYSLEPIVAITINSDVDYMISTNAGVEKYIAQFEE